MLDPDMDEDDYYQGLLVMRNMLDERIKRARLDAGHEVFD